MSADEKLAQYMKLDRQQLLEIAFAHPTFGEWFRAEQHHLVFQELIARLIDGEFGRGEGYNAIQRYFRTKGI